jgi:DivIVA domain-containing protein
MPLSPQRIRDTRFKGSRRGYDQAEVDTFVEEVAAALEAAQNEATAMEARARAAVARLQELSQQAPDAPDRSSEQIHPTVDESETISRALLLAQRTADMTVAEAQTEADRLIGAGRDEAAKMIEESRAEARRAGESERVQVEGEVQALLARRDFLESDVDHLEQYLVAQRERIVEAVSELSDLVQRVPNGLGDMRRPLLSAAAEDDTAAPAAEDDTAAPAGGDDELAEIARVVDDGSTADAAAGRADDGTAEGVEVGADGGPPTMQIPRTREGEPG